MVYPLDFALVGLVHHGWQVAARDTAADLKGDTECVRTQERACSSVSRFRRKLRGTTGHRLLGTQRPQMLCVAAWVELSG